MYGVSFESIIVQKLQRVHGSQICFEQFTNTRMSLEKLKRILSLTTKSGNQLNKSVRTRSKHCHIVIM